MTNDDNARRAACRGPEQAYDRALREGPSDETRAAARGRPEWAYLYAHNVDRGPRDDTRAAVGGKPKWAYHYARDVDGLTPVFVGRAGGHKIQVIPGLPIVNVGCQYHTLKVWQETWESLADRHGVSITAARVAELLTAAEEAVGEITYPLPNPRD